MGLCKCPWRKVTNQFCFEHRVNVCENCMVTNHPKCIVQSYLQWLQDSDWNPICTLCSEKLSNGECIRLNCYHVYHWFCLDKYARSLPSTTAPAGYTCPSCSSPLFPQTNLVSPVADVLREKLASVNWARAGLGLPLLSEEREEKPVQEGKSSIHGNSVLQDYKFGSPPSSLPTTGVITPRGNITLNHQSSSVNNVNLSGQRTGPPFSVVNIDSSVNRESSKKVFEAYDDPKDVSFDHDDNKYRRKSAYEWLSRWWNIIKKPTVRRKYKIVLFHRKYFILIFLTFIIFLLIVVVFSWMTRTPDDSDASFSVFQERQVNIQRDEIAE